MGHAPNANRSEVILLDELGLVRRLNEEALVAWGWQLRQVLGLPFMEVLGAKHEASWVSQVFKAAIKGTVGRLRLLCTEGDGAEVVVDFKLWPTTWHDRRAVLLIPLNHGVTASHDVNAHVLAHVESGLMLLDRNASADIKAAT